MPGPYYSKIKETKGSTSFVAGKGSLTNTDPEIILGAKTSVIDVVRDFNWSASPPTPESVQKIPKVFLTERRQELNSVVSGALYFLRQAANTGADLTSISTKLTELVGGTNVAQTVQQAASNLKNFIQSNSTSGDDISLLKSAQYLQSYIGIYYTKTTGFKYCLPYLGDNLIDTSNSFGQNAQFGGVIANAVDTGMKVINEAADALNISQPGTFIERPRHFQYPTEGKTITVSFPLVNTIQNGREIPYQQNYELLWLLAFQNRPYRTSFSRIIPPKIYTLVMPGQEFFPYCYISNMTVNFVGTRRLLPVTLPSGGQVETTIPEAYTVSLQFTSLLAQIGNTMISPTFAQKITTSTR